MTPIASSAPDSASVEDDEDHDSDDDHDDEDHDDEDHEDECVDAAAAAESARLRLEVPT